MSFRSVLRKARRNSRLQRRIDCRWCGSTNFAEAWWLFYCPQCKATMPDQLLATLQNMEISLAFFFINMYLNLHLDQISTFEQFWLWKHTIERYKDLLEIFHLGNIWGIQLTIFVVSIIVIKLLDFLLSKLHLPLLQWWGWRFQSKTANWVCIPTPLPKHYVFSEIYLYFIRPIGMQQAILPTGVVSLILAATVSYIPLPLSDIDVFTYTKRIILLMSTVGFLIGFVPHKNPANRIVVSLLAFYVVLILWPSQLTLSNWLYEPTLQYSLVLGWMKLVTVTPLTISFIGAVYVGIELSIILFGKSKFQFITRPIPVNEMKRVKTLPQVKQHWFNLWGEELTSEVDTKLDKFLRILLAPLFLIMYKWIQKNYQKTKEEWDNAVEERASEKIAKEKQKKYQESFKELEDWNEVKKGYLFALREDTNGNLTKPVIFMPVELLVLVKQVIQSAKAKSHSIYSTKVIIPLSYERAYIECLYSLSALDGYELITEDITNTRIIAQTVYRRFFRSELIFFNFRSITTAVTEIEVSSQSIYKWQVDRGTNQLNVEKIKLYFSTVIK